MAQCVRCGRVISGFSLRRVCVWCKRHAAAQRGEDTRYQPLMANPWQRRESMPLMGTQAIFGINAAVFIAMLLSSGTPMMFSAPLEIAWGANFAPFTLNGQWWRLLTACFVHGGLLHLVFNLWCLWSLGEMAERLYGLATYLSVYVLCGLGASLASLWWHQPPVVSVGASGAIFGVAGALIASLKLGEFRWTPLAQGRMQGVLLFVLYNVLLGALSGRTDNACHLGGLLTGLILGAAIARLAPEQKPWPRLAILALVAALLAGGFLAIQHRRAGEYFVTRAEDDPPSLNQRGM